MAVVRIPSEDRQITDNQELCDFLGQFGIWYEKWEVESRVGSDPTDQQILDGYNEEIERLKEKGGFVTADVINVNPETPNLDAMLQKFSKEHTHSEDEVRFTIKGSGVFHIHPKGGPVFGVQVEKGDLINVPKGTRHWFDLCDDRTIRCIRLFEDPAGWAPEYVDDPVHENYTAVCWGPDYVGPADEVDPVVKV